MKAGKSIYQQPDSSWVPALQIVENIAQVRQKLGLDAFIFPGQDYGSRWALLYTVNHPQYVKKMALIGGAMTNDENGRQLRPYDL